MTILLFRYFLKELLPLFFTTLVVFCFILSISQLMRLSEMLIAFGLSFENILLPFLYIITPFLTMIIPISFLFAVMMAYARLSADGEIAALLASGVSLRRSSVPILLVAALLYGAGHMSAKHLEAWGRREFVQFTYQKSQTELDSLLRFKLKEGVFLPDFIGYVLYAEKISKDRTTLKNVMLAPGAKKDKQSFILTAPLAKIEGSVKEGSLRMILFDGLGYDVAAGSKKASTFRFKQTSIDVLRVFQGQILGADLAKDDYRSYTSNQLYAYKNELRTKYKKPNEKQIAHMNKVEFLWFSRFSNPFAVFTFAFFGIIFGAFDPRRSKNSGYLGTIFTVLAGYVFIMGFKWMAENGHMQPILAAWAPHALLSSLGFFLLLRKNKLPLSENVFKPSNWIGRRVSR